MEVLLVQLEILLDLLFFLMSAAMVRSRRMKGEEGGCGDVVASSACVYIYMKMVVY